MTFSSRLMRLQIGGPLFGEESWSIGLHFTAPPESETPAEDLKAPTEGFMTAVQSFLHSSALLGFVKWNELDHITGKYSNANETNAAYYGVPFNAAGTGYQNGLPQASQCVTITTALQRGRGHSGRVYLPGHGTPTANGHVDSAQCVTMADAVANYGNSVALLTGAQWVIWSKLGDSVTPVTGTKVGDVVDTQRRRRSSIKEVYYPGVVSVP